MTKEKKPLSSTKKGRDKIRKAIKEVVVTAKIIDLKKENKKLKQILAQSNSHRDSYEIVANDRMAEIRSLKEQHEKSKAAWSSQEVGMLNRLITLARDLELSQNKNDSFIKVIERLGEDIRESQDDFERLKRSIYSQSQNIKIKAEHKGMNFIKYPRINGVIDCKLPIYSSGKEINLINQEIQSESNLTKNKIGFI